MPTIQTAQKGKTLEAAGDRPELVIWTVKVKTPDGEVDAELLRKPDSPAPTGDVTLQETQHGWKAKLVQQPFAGGGSKDFKADPAKLRAENARSALHAAKDLVVADKLPLDQLGTYTGRLYDYIESKAQVGE